MTLLYGTGLRLLECLQLRVKDIALQTGEIRLRDGKGGKDRVTVLQGIVQDALWQQLREARCQHENDLVQGLGRAPLPDALVRKYPNADREWAWQPKPRRFRRIFTASCLRRLASSCLS